jgi:hypothetical protein
MKKKWDVEELVERFTFLPMEMNLLSNKTPENRLGFAVFFKFFQDQGYFPQSKQDIPDPEVTVCNGTRNCDGVEDGQGESCLRRAQVE